MTTHTPSSEACGSVPGRDAAVRVALWADGRRRRPWKPRTVNLMLFVLGSVLDDAHKQGLVARNVAALVDRLPQIETEMQTFTPAAARDGGRG